MLPRPAGRAATGKRLEIAACSQLLSRRLVCPAVVDEHLAMHAALHFPCAPAALPLPCTLARPLRAARHRQGAAAHRRCDGWRGARHDRWGTCSPAAAYVGKCRGRRQCGIESRGHGQQAQCQGHVRTSMLLYAAARLRALGAFAACNDGSLRRCPAGDVDKRGYLAAASGETHKLVGVDSGAANALFLHLWPCLRSILAACSHPVQPAAVHASWGCHAKAPPGCPYQQGCTRC